MLSCSNLDDLIHPDISVEVFTCQNMCSYKTSVFILKEIGNCLFKNMYSAKIR